MNLRAFINESLWKSVEELTLPTAKDVEYKYNTHPGKDDAVSYLHKRELENSFKLQMLHAPDVVFYVPFKSFRFISVKAKSNSTVDIEGDDSIYFVDGVLSKVYNDGRPFPVKEGLINAEINFEYYLENKDNSIDRIEQSIRVEVFLPFKLSDNKYSNFIIEPGDVRIFNAHQSNGIMKVIDRQSANKLETFINQKLISYFTTERGKHGNKIMDKFILPGGKLIHRNQLMIY